MTAATTTRPTRNFPITKQQFRTDAPTGKEVLATLVDAIDLTAREFSSGGFGYAGSGKIALIIRGVPVKCRVTIVASVVGSNHATDSASPTC